MTRDTAPADLRVNADFRRRAVVRPSDYVWTASPMPGVERMMLDRVGGEVARATSLVRYAPDSAFSEHEHGGGEEYLVLEGTFADEHGRYPAGTYVRNPIGTRHAPRVGSDGATIFVKLHQFDPADTRPVLVDANTARWQPGRTGGMTVLPLHEHGGERVALVRLAPYTTVPAHDHENGEEYLVLEGEVLDEQGTYPAGSWVRNPPGTTHQPYTAGDGALVYVKSGHLAAGTSRSRPRV